MKFTEFFKLYFEITDRQYSDKIIWDSHSDNYKKATQKGQNPRISKLVAISKDKNNKISISFTTKKAKIIINNEKITINSEQNNVNTLLEEIANKINQTPQLS